MNIILDKVTVSLGGKTLLKELSLEFPSKKITVITGANGCGKSTLLRTAAGILHPESGKVVYDDKDISFLSPGQLARIRSAVWQNPGVPPDMSVRELLELSSYSSRKSENELYNAACNAGCEKLLDRILTTLSGGELKRAFLALALAQKPEILFLDELEANCDANFRSNLPVLLKELCREYSLTVVMVMHDLDLALHCADHLAVMREGKMELFSSVTACDFPDKLREFAGEYFTISRGEDDILQALLRYSR